MMASTDASPELESLREEVNRLRKEIVDARVERAAKHLELMRNWMGFYTPMVTLVFVLFALLGWRGLSDVEAGRARVEAKATEVEKAAANINSTIELLRSREADFTALVNENRLIVSKNRVVFRGFVSSLDELEKKDTALRDSAGKIEGQVKKLSLTVSDNASQLSNSTTLTSGLGTILSASLNVPLILSGPTVETGGDESFGGNGFGSEAGKLYFRAVTITLGSPLPSSLDLSVEPNVSQFPSTDLKEWSDNRIVFNPAVLKTVASAQSENVALAFEFQAWTRSGLKSNVYRFLPVPAPPSN